MGIRAWRALGAVLLVMGATPSFAYDDVAPTPRRAPREPVAKQVIFEHQNAMPASRMLDGNGIVLDSEKIKLGGAEIRLFGIVPPQLSASFGPQARAALDKLVQNAPIHCVIRDRANDGRLLGTCTNAGHMDIAQEMLRQGFAVSARGSLTQTEVAGAYIAAEQAAQSQKLGLWSGVAANNASLAIIPTPQAKPEVPPSKAESSGKIEVLPSGADVKIDPIAAASLLPQPPAKKVEMAATAASVIAANPDALTAEDEGEVVAPTLLERYQIFATGLLLFLTVLSVIAAVFLQKKTARREELRSIAAALRGELMAARAVCLARFQLMEQGQDKELWAWPRIRVLVFQAYVGRIGLLGAEMARQIASIYGLASDYASFYNQRPTEEVKAKVMDKRQSLQKLIGHIDTVLPRLAALESKKPWFGRLAPSSKKISLAKPVSRPVLEQNETLSLSSSVPADEKQNEQCVPMQADKIADDTFSKAIEKEEPVAEVLPVASEEKPSLEENIVLANKEQEPHEEAVVSFVEARKEVSFEKRQEAEKQKESFSADITSSVKDGSKKIDIHALLRAAPASVQGAVNSNKNIKGETAWARLKHIKDTLQEKCLFHTEPVSPEEEEYLAMLNAEAEAFAAYESEETSFKSRRGKRRRRS